MPKEYKAPFYTEDEIESLQEVDMHYPYSCKYMRYDGKKRQYIPTEALLLKYDIDLEATLQYKGGNIEQELEHISDQVYSYISKHSGSSLETLKYKIARGLRKGMTPYRFRNIFLEIFVKQAKFYLENDDITMHSGVDIVEKKWIQKGVLLGEDRQIHPIVQMLLYDLGLCWQGAYDATFESQTMQQDW